VVVSVTALAAVDDFNISVDIEASMVLCTLDTDSLASFSVMSSVVIGCASDDIIGDAVEDCSSVAETVELITVEDCVLGSLD
jgi:hypothetical protein